MVDDWARNPWLWAFSTATRMNLAAMQALRSSLRPPSEDGSDIQLPWSTPNETILDLRFMSLRRFAAGSGDPVIIVSPLALHGPAVADLAPGHSLVERLLLEEVGPLYQLAWKSAGNKTRYLGIDDYLCGLLLAVEETGTRANLVGICQGGWLALMFATRFPHKVARLVCAGAPVDVEAGPSLLSTAARSVPLASLAAFVEQEGGIVKGRSMLDFWRLGAAGSLEGADETEILQTRTPSSEARGRFAEWDARVVDLPGAYLLQVVGELFQDNRLARGEFVALGRRLDLKTATMPICLMAANNDQVAPPAQAFGAEKLLGTPASARKRIKAKGGHLSLFMGRQTLAGPWRDAAQWLKGPIRA